MSFNVCVDAALFTDDKFVSLLPFVVSLLKTIVTPACATKHFTYLANTLTNLKCNNTGDSPEMGKNDMSVVWGQVLGTPRLNIIKNFPEKYLTQNITITLNKRY